MDRRDFLKNGALAAGSVARKGGRVPAPEYHLEPLLLKVNGFRFDAIAAGPLHGELVLLLHGFPQFADAWKSIMPSIAAEGYRVVAVDQRGYSSGARPPSVDDYATSHLVADAIGFAEAVQASRFHLVGHDWGGVVAWRLAAAHPEQLRSLTVLSTPHLDAFSHALKMDPDQQRRSGYIQLFQAPNHAAEKALLADNAKVLRSAYAGKLSQKEVEANVRRLSEDGTLTAALSWYRAADLGTRIGPIAVPTLYVWGDQDQALGEVAAMATGKYVKGPYRFERLRGRSHWLLEEVPGQIAQLVLGQLKYAAS